MNQSSYFWRSLYALAVSVVLLLAAACRDEVPTITDPRAFPPGVQPVTGSVVLSGASVQTLGQFAGFAEADSGSFLLAANRFERALDARALIRFTGFPDSLQFQIGGQRRSDTSFVYGTGQVIARLDSAASTLGQPVTLRLFVLGESFDAGSATFAFASDTGGVRVRFRTPGGTLADPLAAVTVGGTGRRDSLVFVLDSLTVARIARRGVPGVAVVAETPGSRVQFGPVSLRTSARPRARRDTAIAITAGAEQTFVFTPESPGPRAGLEAGGLSGSRTLLRIVLPDSVPACAENAANPAACPRVALRDVALNRAALLLRPVAVAGGFRPLGPDTLFLQRVGEPELGRFAPLGEPVARAGVVAAGFAAGGSPADVSFDLTGTIVGIGANRERELNLVLLAPQMRQFGVFRFEPDPRVRLIYTVPSIPRGAR